MYSYDDELIYIVYYLIRINLVLFPFTILENEYKKVLASKILYNYYYKKECIDINRISIISKGLNIIKVK